MEIPEFQRRFRFEFLDEMAVPMQAAHEGGQPLALPDRIRHSIVTERLEAPLGGLHKLAHAQATEGQIRRKPGAGCRSGER